MKTDLVPYRITICGLAELCGHSQAGITHVVTILDPEWPDPADFATYAPHRREVWRFHDIIGEQPGMVHPEPAHVEAILELGERLRAEPVDHLLVHCHMGVSRSTATAAILLAQHNPGREAEVFAHVGAIRRQAWPNSRMVRFADELLGRGGALVGAMQDLYHRTARINPELLNYLKQSERRVEVPEAFR